MTSHSNGVLLFSMSMPFHQNRMTFIGVGDSNNMPAKKSTLVTDFEDSLHSNNIASQV
jgi:hypothetical protein